MPEAHDPAKDYIQIVHNHAPGTVDYEPLGQVGPANSPTHTVRLLIDGIERCKAKAGSVRKAKKICAYQYLKDNDLLTQIDNVMEALLNAQ
ncbi:hypothetical protein NMY22_g11301 [Coprinellus aureogranulatus]|nr:hypothetical protein NMY22_g11301 [Coprinellus aureogranulatus]